MWKSQCDVLAVVNDILLMIDARVTGASECAIVCPKIAHIDPSICAG
jgi:hypothetical protein